MKLIQRVGYYLGGFSIGLILLAFFLSGKKISCSYGPNARVIKNINIKPLQYSEASLQYIENKKVDTALISSTLKKGNVNFSLSNTKLDSCKIYVIEKDFKQTEIQLTVENCDSLAILKSIIVN
ncbi:hypothetical protein [Pontimicrobium aquaticum]|uniref:DUF4258 domain-containing protein n=1 Tax=Pontimicrobium aquaticum TaxID=2565367 RepID=A0A4V5LQ06_9FLAO|nr:hypothetical protein [Pontimicrobium aquaticum]TJY33429.1 hypothetical protein E5167_13085 [Pontimicrobium aquaticum]